MSLSILSPIRSYQVRTEAFEGPLDLLLHLLERMELDITRISLARITDQYLAHLRTMPERSPEEMSAFLVVAARLLQMKSAALLPRAASTDEPDEPDPGRELVRQLRRYRMFKDRGQWLASRVQQGLRTHPRPHGDPVPVVTLRLEGADVAALHAAARRVLLPRAEATSVGVTLAPPRFTVREKIRALLRTLRRRGRTTFFRFLRRARHREEIPVSFLALLELVKRRVVTAHQPELFGDIEIRAREAAALAEPERASEDMGLGP